MERDQREIELRLNEMSIMLEGSSVVHEYKVIDQRAFFYDEKGQVICDMTIRMLEEITNLWRALQRKYEE